jgi:osmotically inducible protein OsmC
MALSMILGKEGYTPESLEAKATITMDTENLELTASHLVLNAQIPDISNEKFLECANMAKENCPVSKVLNLKITLEATLNK